MTQLAARHRIVRFRSPNGKWQQMTFARAAEYSGQAFARGQAEEAEAALRRLLELEPTNGELLNLLLAVSGRLGKPELAIGPFQKAVARKGGVAALYRGLGRALRSAGREEEALAALRRAVSLDPTDLLAHLNLGAALEKLGRFEEEAVHFQEALAFPHSRDTVAALCTCLGSALGEVGRLEESLAVHRRAREAARGTAAEAGKLSDLACALGALGQFEERLACYERAQELNPSPLTHTNFSFALLLSGNYARGLREYESRLEMVQQAGSVADLAKIRWHGSDPAGKKIMVYHEQGLGDTIHFARYVPLLRERGATVFLIVRPQLKRLFASLPGVEKLLTAGEPAPFVDLQCPLTSLPLAFGTTLETIPQRVPYLHAEEALRREWRTRLGASPGRKVGLVWAGNPEHKNDRNRSLPLELLRPLLATPDTVFYSLQVGPKSTDPERLGLASQVHDLSPFLTDFAETAAALAEMDLLIAVDTSVAHLAGALGVTTWTLVPLVPDWRWLLDREDSPWYPTMRLFRQTKQGGWPGVIERVQAGLEQLSHRDAPQIDDRSSSAMLPVTNTQPAPCKVCGGESPLLGVVDFHKSCIEAQGKRLNVSGIPIYYRRCRVCGFVFTGAFDAWQPEAFHQKIYNGDYIVVDPDFAALRPMNNAQLVGNTFRGSRESLRIVDYGGGNGVLAKLLRDDGFQAETYDPFSTFAELPAERCDLLTCFEVMEHVPFPGKTLAEMVSLLKDEGAILFSTLLQPDNFDQMGLNWWYAGPRNGHISLHSRKSMVSLFQQQGMQTASFSDGLHLAFRKLPSFAAQLIRQ